MWKKPKVRLKRIVQAIRFSLKAVFSGFYNTLLRGGVTLAHRSLGSEEKVQLLPLQPTTLDMISGIAYVANTPPTG